MKRLFLLLGLLIVSGSMQAKTLFLRNDSDAPADFWIHGSVVGCCCDGGSCPCYADDACYRHLEPGEKTDITCSGLQSGNCWHCVEAQVHYLTGRGSMPTSITLNFVSKIGDLGACRSPSVVLTGTKSRYKLVDE